MEPQDPKPPRPRQPSKPELPKASVDKTVGVASEDQRRFDLPKRSATLTGMPAPAAPGSKPPPAPAAAPPPLPTKRAPAPWGKTMRAPTPPEVLAQARRDPPPLPTPAPTGVAIEPEPVPNETPPASQRKPSPLPAPSQRPEDARVAAQAREIERLRSERDKAREAVEKAHAEALAKASEPPPSEGVSNEAIGRIVREVTSSIGKKLGLPAFFMACIGGGGYAVHTANEKPVPPPLTAAQLDERLGKFERKAIGRLDALTVTQNGAIDVVRCMRKKTNQIGGSLLPAPDRMGAALKQSPYEDDCPDSPKKLPEPQQP